MLKQLDEIVRQRLRDSSVMDWRAELSPRGRAGAVETHEYSESAFVARFRVAGMGLSFLPSEPR